MLHYLETNSHVCTPWEKPCQGKSFREWPLEAKRQNCWSSHVGSDLSQLGQVGLSLPQRVFAMANFPKLQSVRLPC